MYLEPRRIIGLLVVFLNFMFSIQAGVIVALKLKKFDNFGSYAYGKGSNCGRVGLCNIFFKICIKPSVTAPTNLNGCWYQKNTRDRDYNSRSVDFSKVDTGIPKVIKIKKKSWPGNFGFYIEVWDKDYVTADDKLDIHSYGKEISPEVNGSRLLTYNEVSSGQRPNTPVSNLTFDLQVYCDLYYYGPDCEKYCKEKNDVIGGHYTCDNSGKHVCRSGWFNLPNCLTHCVPQDDSINGYFTCTKNGTRVCRQGWYGEPTCTRYCVPQDSDTNGHYVCSQNGTRICSSGWYGKACNVRFMFRASSIVASDARTTTETSRIQSLRQTTRAPSPSHSPSSVKRKSVTTNIAAVTTSIRETTRLLFATTKVYRKLFSTMQATSSKTFAKSSNFAASPSQHAGQASKTVAATSVFVATSKTIASATSSAVSTSNLPTPVKKVQTSTPINPSVSNSAISTSQMVSSKLYHSTKDSNHKTLMPSPSSTLVLSSKQKSLQSIDKDGALSSSFASKFHFLPTYKISRHASRQLHGTSMPSLAMNQISSHTKGLLTTTPRHSQSYIKTVSSLDSKSNYSPASIVSQSSFDTTSSSSSVAAPFPPSVSKESDADIFVWMINTRKGNLVFVGFALALVFFIAFVLAVFKICRLRRYSKVQRNSIRKMKSSDELEDEEENDINEQTGENFKMCSTACFGVIRKVEPQFPYQKHETGI